MFSSVVNLNNLNLPIAMTIGCSAIMALLAGRKVSQFLASGTYMVSSKIALYMNNKDLAESFQKTSMEYLNTAKKNLVRDLTFAVIMGVATLGISQIGLTAFSFEKPEEEIDSKEILIFPNGEYLGNVKNNKMHGQGILITTELIYEGEFKDNRMNGQGTLITRELKYVGGFKDSKMNGQGTLTLPDKNEFVGGFKDDKLHGKITITLPDGLKSTREYKDGKIA
jgi:hypothetical protein